MKQKQYRDKVIVKKRMLFVFGILFLLFFLLIVRLSYIMINQSEKLSAKAKDQWTSEVKIDAKRGRILDKNGNELAVSANVYRVDLDMNTLRGELSKMKLSQDEIPKKMEEIAGKLAEAVAMDKAEVLKILNRTLPDGSPMGSATLKRRIDKAQADKVRDINIKGILVSSDTKRYYPYNNFLSHVLGHTNSDGVGMNGVELTYNKELSGIPGVRIAETDRKSETLPYTISEYTKPVDGKDLVLTIDEMIQSFCEKAAQQALMDNKAKAVTIVAMDPKNGEILAMVNKPDYNPNNPWQEGKTSDELQKMWRNRAVSDTFEPGSIFKVITSVAAMQENLVKETDTFNCNGSNTVANRVIHCWKTSGHGLQNFVGILENSCNVGFMELGKRLGAEKLNKYIYQFGFGTKTGVDLPGEASGIVRKTEKFTDVDLATTSFGQGDTVSCIQYLTALNAVANGGIWVKPHLMKEIVHYDDNNKRIVDKTFDNSGSKRIVEAQVVNTLRGYLEKVISEGGGQKAFVPGYHIAGKTGTAQKISPNGGYEPGKYVASFGGMAPASDPRVTLLISIDEPDPSNYYAGQIAAPVAKQVYNDIFNYLALKVDASGDEVSNSLLKDVIIPNVRGQKKAQGVKTLKDVQLDVQVEGDGEYIVDTNPIPGYTVKEGTKVVVYTGSLQTDNKMIMVPELKGYSKERATAVLNSIGLKAQINGEGLVSDQSVEPNAQVNRGTTIKLNMDITAGD